MRLGAVLLTVGRSYVGNYVTHSTLLDRACACSYENLPKHRSYRVSNTVPWIMGGVTSMKHMRTTRQPDNNGEIIMKQCMTFSLFVTVLLQVFHTSSFPLVSRIAVVCLLLSTGSQAIEVFLMVCYCMFYHHSLLLAWPTNAHYERPS